MAGSSTRPTQPVGSGPLANADTVMTLASRRLISLAALVLYLVVQLPVRGTHHHEPRAAADSPAHACRWEASGQAGDDGDHDCPVCRTLYLAQAPATAVPPLARAGRTGTAIVPQPLRPHHTLPLAVHSRGPPSA